MAPSSIFNVNQYLEYENNKQQPIFDHAFSVMYTVEFVFSNKYDATEKNPWSGKFGIILKLQNDINITNGNTSLIICGIVKEVLLAKADGVKFEPDLKGRSKSGRRSIIDMDSQEAQIIADAVELGMSALTACSFFNYHREVEELPSLCMSAVKTCISKLKPLVEKVKNRKQESLDINSPTCKARLLWCLHIVIAAKCNRSERRTKNPSQKEDNRNERW